MLLWDYNMLIQKFAWSENKDQYAIRLELSFSIPDFAYHCSVGIIFRIKFTELNTHVLYVSYIF